MLHPSEPDPGAFLRIEQSWEVQFVQPFTLPETAPSRRFSPLGRNPNAQQSHLDFLSRSRELGTRMGHADVNEMPDLRQPCGLDCGADRRQVYGEAAPM